jgi:hypothetical protein
MFYYFIAEPVVHVLVSSLRWCLHRTSETPRVMDSRGGNFVHRESLLSGDLEDIIIL